MTALTGKYVARDSAGNGTTARGARLADAGLLAKNSDGTVRVGVLLDGQGAVVTGAAGMSYSVRKHVAVTKASEANGPVLVPNDGVVSVTTDPAPGSNSRWDVIYSLQPLVSGDGGSSTSVAPIIDVAKGTASATPSVPSIPTGALELARVPVPSGTTATSGLTFTQGPVTWVGGGVVRSYVRADTPAGYNAGSTIGTVTFPAVPVASRILLSVDGKVGFAAGSNIETRVGFSVSAGTLTDPDQTDATCVTPGRWYSYSKMAWVDVPANTEVKWTTVLFSTQAPGSYWLGVRRGEVLLPGEY
jgi:hypothetical protein